MKRHILLMALSATILSAHAADYIRANRIGYLVDDIKAAIFMGDSDPSSLKFDIVNSNGNHITPDSIVVTEPWKPLKHSARIYFTSMPAGEYTVVASKDDKVVASTPAYIGNDAYSRLSMNELPLYYLRQQRCGDNPAHNQLCHQKDALLVLSGANDGKHIDVRGGWHDASDYLQYLTTSANTVYQMLFAYKQNPGIWQDHFDATGREGANGIPDILDEARWGLEWMQRMNPSDSLYLNQIADDRDHTYGGVPYKDTADYGWGPGQERPVYPCIGTPAGLRKYKNESSGLASSIGKFASSFGLGAEIFASVDPDFAADLARRSAVAYEVGVATPGACQTTSTVSPYYYEEDNYSDDMELAAMARYRATSDPRFLREAIDYGRMEPVTPWMGADSAKHYQWYPFVNLGHYELAATNPSSRESREFLRNMRSGLSRVAERGADNAFLMGVPFIWCSNNLAVAYVTQAMLYRDLTGDNTYRETETAVRDWLFGANPWGQVMVILPQSFGLPSPQDSHSAMTDATVNGRPGRDYLVGGLVDGPVYTNIFNSLRGVHLRRADAYADIQSPIVVYHDDFSDYSTNEPTMDGTASLTYMLGRLTAKGKSNL